jgi:D-amino peptidase
MKILISADMEGISGITQWDMVTPGHHEYLSRGRSLMTGDVNAAIDGAFEAGATELVVSDGHWDGRNILIEELDPRAKLNTGTPSPFSMMQGIQNRPDAVLLVGYHATSGAAFANLDHTWSDLRVRAVFWNGQLTGEIGLNAIVAGHFGVPIILMTGDQTACAEAKKLLGAALEVAIVKQATSEFAAECLSLVASRQLIHEAAARAITKHAKGKSPKPYKTKTPATVMVDFVHARHADRASLMPGTQRLNGTQVQYTAPDVPTAYQAFRAMVSLAGD